MSRPSFSLQPLALSLLFASPLHAAVPVLDYIYPAGGERGKSVSINFGGKIEPWPAEFWTDIPGAKISATTNKNQAVIEIPANAVVGPHLMRAFNGEGASEPRFFMVGAHPEVEEKEPNDSLKQAQPIEHLYATVNGRLEKNGDVDCFSIEAEKGRWIVAALDAYGIGSPMDAHLSIFDERGVKLGLNHDTHNLDPLLAVQAPADGRYIIMLGAFAHPPVAEVRFAGGPGLVYRLTVTDAPYAHHASPAYIRRGPSPVMNLLGWNLSSATPAVQEPVDPAWLATDTGRIQVPTRTSGNTVMLAVGDLPCVLESEPNNQTNQAQSVSVPCAICGTLDARGDVDRFLFTAKKGDRLEFRLRAAWLHSPFDGILRIEDLAGKQLTRDDDGGDAGDPKIGWSAPEDGKYIVAVNDLMHRGSEGYVYVLEVAPPSGDFKATLDKDAYRIEAGKTNEIKVTVNRLGGLTNRLLIAVQNLPEGVKAEEIEVSAKGGETKVALVAATNAVSANRMIRVAVKDTELSRTRMATFDLKGKEPRGERVLTESPFAWLTVSDQPLGPDRDTGKKKKKTNR